MVGDGDRCCIRIDRELGAVDEEDVFRKVIRATGLRMSDFEPPQTSRFEGIALYLKPSPEKKAIFLSLRPVFFQRLERLYNKGTIRAASVEPEGSKFTISYGV